MILTSGSAPCHWLLCSVCAAALQGCTRLLAGIWPWLLDVSFWGPLSPAPAPCLSGRVSFSQPGQSGCQPAPCPGHSRVLCTSLVQHCLCKAMELCLWEWGSPLDKRQMRADNWLRLGSLAVFVEHSGCSGVGRMWASLGALGAANPPLRKQLTQSWVLSDGGANAPSADQFNERHRCPTHSCPCCLLTALSAVRARFTHPNPVVWLLHLAPSLLSRYRSASSSCRSAGRETGRNNFSTMISN